MVIFLVGEDEFGLDIPVRTEEEAKKAIGAVNLSTFFCQQFTQLDLSRCVLNYLLFCFYTFFLFSLLYSAMEHLVIMALYKYRILLLLLFIIVKYN